MINKLINRSIVFCVEVSVLLFFVNIIAQAVPQIAPAMRQSLEQSFREMMHRR